MTFSIVTVVFNDIIHIEKTMESVINQTYKNVEYIIIDGGSTDGTKEKIREIVLKHAEIIQEDKEDSKYFLYAQAKKYQNFYFKFLSQKDKGIFDAMNKGVILSQNDYINFVNCGDFLHNQNVLANIAALNFSADVFYGDLEICYLDHNHKFIKKTSRNLDDLYCLFRDFGHPNCFIKSQVHKKYLYDTNYKLASDYDLIYKLYRNHCKFYFSDIVISTFNSGGASDQNGFKSLREALKIALFYNTNFIVKIKIIFYYFFSLSKKIAKLYLPVSFVKSLLKFKG
ncbi:glycosyltransferase [Helicobacter sp. faydin-H20]|uniref:glycosyltransferase family 2 protein n=1 Tax=Helicobacter anatolicus TaxID=2905874 RepID=UPI001E6534A6|nr:glycosyltransferase family 2 protein [Helicobacter anatolicus]MCE3037019.1 glycosyltransferase [Helicobacter anatolicus]